MPGSKERVFALKTSLYKIPLLKKKVRDVIIADFAKSGVLSKYHITKRLFRFRDVIIPINGVFAEKSNYHITKRTIPEKFAE